MRFSLYVFSFVMDNLEQIKSRINIVDLLREYIELKKAGANWKALCPFHSEKSPSFMVSEDKQIWHCFGCNEGGDIFGFIMRMEGVDFSEALRILAKKAGIVLQRQNPAINSQKTKFIDILEAAANFFFEELKKSSIAKEYIDKRGLSAETVVQFRLGFSPQSWDALLNYLEGRGFRAEDIVSAGLVIEKDGKFFDRFRGRIMFPIMNHYGNVVGFTARVLPQFDDGKMGKYINTPETLLYKKSEILYGLNFAKQDIKKERCVVVVEGNMDVIALHQAGFKNATATSGTAMTHEQLMLLKRFTENIIVCFDADSAGIQAALRGIDLALSHGFNVKVFGMPKNEAGEPIAKDPDELIKCYPELWRQALGAPKHIIEFYIAANKTKYNLGDPHENAVFCQTILGEIKKIKNSVERALWIKKLSDISGASERDLREMSFGPVLRQYDWMISERGAAAPVKDAPTSSPGQKFLALALFGKFPPLAALSAILPEMFEPDEAREFYRDLLFYYNENSGFSLQGFRDFLDSAGKNQIFLDKLALLRDKDYADAEDEDIKREIKNLSLHLRGNYFKERRKILEQEMILAERDGNKEKINDLMKKFKLLNIP